MANPHSQPVETAPFPHAALLDTFELLLNFQLLFLSKRKHWREQALYPGETRQDDRHGGYRLAAYSPLILPPHLPPHWPSELTSLSRLLGRDMRIGVWCRPPSAQYITLSHCKSPFSYRFAWNLVGFSCTLLNLGRQYWLRARQARLIGVDFGDGPSWCYRQSLAPSPRLHSMGVQCQRRTHCSRANPVEIRGCSVQVRAAVPARGDPCPISHSTETDIYD
ncbi:hypothetical protein QBC34DRAFT_190217 [Podospora aff. communis PSN243]|uniref:Uncharacterized protein n=1 Tax=Podospora aff. communis PSN243 TaxID=3040156 RepID=A0AAV9H1V3_9PEZI|nr:hypothetical protein QBC34DRAFT_190217 [Podospora aff. communis PSN243]